MIVSDKRDKNVFHIIRIIFIKQQMVYFFLKLNNLKKNSNKKKYEGFHVRQV